MTRIGTLSYSRIFRGGGNHFTKIRAKSQRFKRIILANFALALFAILNATNLNAVELNTICSQNSCTIGAQYNNQNIENHNNLSFNAITINTNIANFTNYGNLSGSINLTNGSIGTLTNYGVMSGMQSSATNATIIDNFGVINAFTDNTNYYRHFNNTNIIIKNYAMTISENSATFNSAGTGGFTSTNITNSHIVVNNVQNASFQDSNSKILLDFSGNFELGATYSLDKLIVLSTTGTNALNVDFSRLRTRNDIYELSQNGNGFVVSANPSNSTISNLYKANIKTINSLFLQSNKMIFQSKFKGKRLSTRNPQRRVIRRVSENANPFFNAESLGVESKSGESILANPQDFSYLLALDSLDSLQNNESFFYNSDSLLLAQSANQMAIQQRRAMQNPRTRATSQVSNKYYFVLTPFVNYNTYNKSGRYNLSGLEYGFISAFSGKLGFGNTLGAHFGFSYGSLGDKDDSLLKLTSANLMLGLNYKLDLFWNMYVKARGDFYYFLNEVSSVAFDKLKPNSMGFGVSVAYGKDFNFGAGGVLGLELGVDYKGLNTNAISVDSLDNSSKDTYDKALYHLVYVDLGLNYDKYFGISTGLWGINIGAGGRMNLTPKLAKSTIAILNGTRSVDMTIDNDKFLGYVNAGFSYGFEAQKFGMEFGIEYYGNFGDRSMSNAGSFEWKTRW